MKIDVEGYEAEVLAGLEPMLDEGCAPTILLEVHRIFAAGAPAAAANFCARRDYRAWHVLDDEATGTDSRRPTAA